jgi:UDP-2,3-diacylglucosamine pyrophosphatase LpxH
MSGTSKGVNNEIRHPYVVELAIVGDKLEFELGRRIIQFHKSRHVQLRNGRTIRRGNHYYYRWCFADLLIARAFVEQFGGEFCKIPAK